MNEENILILRCGETALKGKNKPYFERALVERVRMQTGRFTKYGKLDIKRHQGLIFLRAPKEAPLEDIIAQVSKVFGVESISHAIEAERDMDSIQEAAIGYMLDLIKKRPIRTFKVEAKRSDKDYPILSPEIARIVGGKILKGCKVLRVDVHNPDCLLFVDVRTDRTYIYEDKIMTQGGLPLGTNGRGMVLLSGGIDSPVAAFMMAKRGMTIEAVHFHSYPYTSERALEKVVRLGKILSQYIGKFNINVINLLPAQEEIFKNCPPDENTLLVRRFMMRIGENLAKNRGCEFLVTGENLGQVASQTAGGLVVTDAAVEMPVMRPLIAFDKVDIMAKAREIGTFETSIEPFEDCCTVFLPAHPVTRPLLKDILESEKLLDIEEITKTVMTSIKVIEIRP